MTDLSSKKSRSKLEPGLYWQRLSRTLSLGYRQGTRGSMWWGREYVGDGYRKESLAMADDRTMADGVDTLSHAQAITRAIAWASKQVQRSLQHTTIGDVVDAYLDHYKADTRDSSKSQVQMAKKWIDGDLRSLEALSFKSADILAWRNALITEGGVAKATANRIRTVLFAALNFGYDYMDLPDPERWRKVKPYSKVNQPRAEFLTVKQAKNLIKAMPDDFRDLSLGALYTGGRYRELTLIRVEDVDIKGSQVHFLNTKSGSERTVPLSKDGRAHFRRLVKGRKGGEFVFVKADGDRWRKSQQMRRIRDAAKAAKFKKPVNFHQFRHTYASLLTQSGMPMRSIQELLGHADMRITVQHYAHLQPGQVAKEVNKYLPSFGGGK